MRRPSIAFLRAEDPRVSLKSVWSDDRWFLDMVGGDYASLRFEFHRIPEAYREVAKMSLWMQLSGAAGPRTKVGTLPSTSDMRYLYDFLARMAPSGIDAVGPAHLALFGDVLRATLGRDYPVGYTAEVPGPVVSQLEALWAQRAEMAHAGLPALRHDPFAGTSPARFMASLGCRDPEPWPPLPLAVSRIVQPHAERVLRRLDCVERLQASVLRLIDEEGGVAGPATLAEVLAWRYEDAEGRIFHSVPASVTTPQRAVEMVKDQVHTVEGAAAWLVWHETGMRPSEFRSPKAGRDEAIGLPSCIEVVRCQDEGLELFLLHGTVFKWRTAPEPGVWTLASRMLGANAMPPAVVAVDALERLHAPWRGDAGSLLVSFNLHGHPVRRCGGGRPKAGRMLKHLRWFLEREVPWADMTAKDVLSREIAASRGRLVVPTHMRKGLVHWCIRLDASLLGPVTTQLQNDDERLVDQAYAGNDPTLLEPAGEYAALELARLMLSRSGASDGLPTAIAESLADVAAVRDTVPEDLLLPIAARLVRTRGLAPPRQPFGSVAPRDPDAASASLLLQRYRANRRVLLEGRAAGHAERFAAFARQADRIAESLADLGIDPPTDEELMECRA